MAQVPVNRKLWTDLSDSERTAIEDVLRGTGALAPGDTLKPTDNAPELPVPDTEFVRTLNVPLANPACEAACNATYAATVSRCNLLPHPAARAVCYGAATAAYGLCLRNC